MSGQAIVLFSGGIDSTTALYWARRRFSKVTALTVDYGQTHRLEVRQARRIARSLKVPHLVVSLPLKPWVSSALLGDGRHIPPGLKTARDDQGVPYTYVPFRNGIFLALAAAAAESRGAWDLVTGFHRLDTPDYPDTSGEFVRRMAAAINSGSAASRRGKRFRIHAPLLRLDKKGIISLGLKLGADYSRSLSCYRGREMPCGRCPACEVRDAAFAALGRVDPLRERLAKRKKK